MKHGNSAKHGHKTSRPGKSHEFTHYTKSEHNPISYLSTNAQKLPQVRGQKRMGFQWSFTKTYLGLTSPIICSSTKFEVKPVSGLSANAWKLFYQPEARKQLEISRESLKVDRAWRVSKWDDPPNSVSIWCAVCLQMPTRPLLCPPPTPLAGND